MGCRHAVALEPRVFLFVHLGLLLARQGRVNLSVLYLLGALFRRGVVLPHFGDVEDHPRRRDNHPVLFEDDMLVLRCRFMLRRLDRDALFPCP